MLGAKNSVLELLRKPDEQQEPKSIFHSCSSSQFFPEGTFVLQSDKNT